MGGKNLYEIFPQDIADQLYKNDLKVYETGSAIEVEETAKAKDGSSLTFLTVKFSVYDSSKIPFGICGISTDITSCKVIEKEVQKLKK